MRIRVGCVDFGTLAVLAVGLLLTTPAGSAETLTGKVIKVADGDTLTLLVGTEQIRIRLHGIDSPEQGQAFGDRAKQALAGDSVGTGARLWCRRANSRPFRNRPAAAACFQAFSHTDT